MVDVFGLELTPADVEVWRRLPAMFEQKPAERYLYDPVGWARDVVDWSDGGHLTGYQEEILDALATRRRAAVRGCHGLGKTTLAAIVVLWLATTRDAAGIDWKVITTASAWRQLNVYLWPEIHKWARRIRWDVLGREAFDEKRELLDLHLKLSVGAASAVASNDPAKIEGAHADSLLYVFDESKIIPAGTWDAAEGGVLGRPVDGPAGGVRPGGVDAGSADGPLLRDPQAGSGVGGLVDPARHRR